MSPAGPRRRRIALVTGSRADFGHLSRLALRLRDDPEVAFQLLVTGSHLSRAHGATVSEIEQLGFEPAARIPIDMSDDSGAALSKALGAATIGFADAFESLRPDIVVLLGDRYEMLAPASAALLQSIPLAHIHGGETTVGALDESIRHALSKMASLHFAAAEPYRERLLRMGEQPDRVYCFGAPAIEAVRDSLLLTKEALENELGFGLGSPLAAVTFHPATRAVGGARKETTALLAALEGIKELRIVMTGVNADPGAADVARLLQEFAASHKDRVLIVPSLGQRRYLSLLACADVMIGNSSSGYIEAPTFGLPVVDIGDRQTGRLAAACIQRVPPGPKAIGAAVRRALDPDWRKGVSGQPHPYGAGDFSRRAAEVLKSVELGPRLLRKPFHESKHT